jgi:hypothetical protein
VTLPAGFGEASWNFSPKLRHKPHFRDEIEQVRANPLDNATARELLTIWLNHMVNSYE